MIKIIAIAILIFLIASYVIMKINMKITKDRYEEPEENDEPTEEDKKKVRTLI